LPGVTPNTSSMDTTQNHGMHGVQDLANVLLRAGRKFHIVTGHYMDERTVAEVKSWCNAARTVNFLRHMRIGLLGYPMEGMGDFGIDETAFLAQVGVQVSHIATKDVAEYASAAPKEEVARQMAEDRNRFQFQEDITEKEYEASSRLEWALRKILRERGMHGFASQCGGCRYDERADWGRQLYRDVYHGLYRQLGIDDAHGRGQLEAGAERRADPSVAQHLGPGRPARCPVAVSLQLGAWRGHIGQPHHPGQWETQVHRHRGSGS
jgi:hypothetical protein